MYMNKTKTKIKALFTDGSPLCHLKMTFTGQSCLTKITKIILPTNQIETIAMLNMCKYKSEDYKNREDVSTQCKI